MSRPRTAADRTLEGKQWVTRFFHPISRKTCRLVLGHEDNVQAAKNRLEKLNAIFLDEARWYDLPKDTPEDIKQLWKLHAGVEKFKPEDFTDNPMHIAVQAIKGRMGPKAADDAFKILTKPLDDEIEQLRDRIRVLELEVKHWKGMEIREGECPTLEAALKEFKKTIRGDSGYVANVVSALDRFVREFGPKTLVDDLVGGEKKIDTWVAGLTDDRKGKDGQLIAPGRNLGSDRKRAIRQYVIRFLTSEQAGLVLKKVAAVNGTGRTIRYLEPEQAAAVMKLLPTYWAKLFQFHCGTGLRPSELLTLHKENFASDFSRLTLKDRGTFTLKEGPRTVRVPPELRATVEEQVKVNPVVFPQPDGRDWQTEEWFYRCYKRELRKACAAAGVLWQPTCRTPRHTCGSLLLRSGLNYVEIAAVLGNTPDIVKRHYAGLKADEIKMDAAVIGVKKPVKKKHKAKAGVRRGRRK